jgi:hypothetical protein
MADKTMESVLIFGAVGLAAWWGYETYVALPAGVPSTGAWNGYLSVTGTGSRNSPTAGDLWFNVAAPASISDINAGQAFAGSVVAQYSGTAWVATALAGTAQTAAPVNTLATSAPASTPATSTVTSCPAGYTLTGGACIPNPPATPVFSSPIVAARLAAIAEGGYINGDTGVISGNDLSDPAQTGSARSVRDPLSTSNASLSGLGSFAARALGGWYAG